MGSQSNPGDNGALGTASDKASSVASSVGDAATAAPSAARQKTQGNPLAAGLIAFGAGWLISSLLPASEKEKQAASTVKDKAGEHSDTLTAPLKEAAGNAKENLQGPAQDAVTSVKDKATDAASTVKDEAASAKDDVAGRRSRPRTRSGAATAARRRTDAPNARPRPGRSPSGVTDRAFGYGSTDDGGRCGQHAVVGPARRERGQPRRRQGAAGARRAAGADPPGRRRAALGDRPRAGRRPRTGLARP